MSLTVQFIWFKRLIDDLGEHIFGVGLCIFLQTLLLCFSGRCCCFLWVAVAFCWSSWDDFGCFWLCSFLSKGANRVFGNLVLLIQTHFPKHTENKFYIRCCPSFPPSRTSNLPNCIASRPFKMHTHWPPPPSPTLRPLASLSAAFVRAALRAVTCKHQLDTKRIFETNGYTKRYTRFVFLLTLQIWPRLPTSCDWVLIRALTRMAQLTMYCSVVPIDYKRK